MTSEQPKHERQRLIRKALLLSWFTIFYNFVEGAVSITFGVGDESVALFGFGADSFIEVFSASIVLWRFRGETGLGTTPPLERERTATKAIGGLFLVLGLGTLLTSAWQLSRGEHPSSSVPGLVISALSLSFMVFLWTAKRRVGVALESSTVLKDADCSRTCIQLSVILFLGSILYLLAPAFWWADSLAAIALSLLILKEGYETIRNARKPGFCGGCCC